MNQRQIIAHMLLLADCPDRPTFQPYDEAAWQFLLGHHANCEFEKLQDNFALQPQLPSHIPPHFGVEVAVHLHNPLDIAPEHEV